MSNAPPDTATVPLWRRTRLDSATLAACRSGIGREPGTVPAMWQHHTVDGEVHATGHGTDRQRDRFAAEHHALTLWAVHQQGQITDGGDLVPVHASGNDHELGRAFRRLKIPARGPDGSTKPPFNPDAVDRRFHRAITVPTVDGLATHLRGLITQLRTLSPIPPVDYDQLFDALAWWPRPDIQQTIRRRWGLQYQIPESDPQKTDQRPLL